MYVSIVTLSLSKKEESVLYVYKTNSVLYVHDMRIASVKDSTTDCESSLVGHVKQLQNLTDGTYCKCSCLFKIM